MRLRLGWSSLLPMLLAAEPAPAEEAEAPASLSLATRRQLAPGSALHHAADDYADCMEYATCRSEGFHCYKRAGMPYAQCRPETGTHCVEAGLWDPTVHPTSALSRLSQPTKLRPIRCVRQPCRELL